MLWVKGGVGGFAGKEGRKEGAAQLAHKLLRVGVHHSFRFFVARDRVVED